MKKITLLFLLLTFTGTLLAQEENSAVAVDTTMTEENSNDTTAVAEAAEEADTEETDDDVPAYHRAPADSSTISKRSFSQNKLEELRKDPALQYTETPTVGESLIDRIRQWISDLFNSIFKTSVTTNWGRVLTWVIALGVIVIIIFMVLKVNAFNMFFSGKGAASVKHNIFEENIHEMDFDKLIQEAINQNDYRKGVRLVFLYALKLLADKQLIHWEQGKTNHDYVAELKAGDLRNGLNDLSFYFDYAWYGNFNINRELFTKVNGIFANWKTNLR